jgi:hypothetical protein
MPALKPDERVEFEPLGQGPEGFHFRFKHGIRVDEVFIRVLTKIAFETICWHRGADYCADTRWHRLRAFILRAEGKRTYGMPKKLEVGPGTDGVLHVPVGIMLEPAQSSIGEQWLAAIRVGPSFVVDVSADNLLLTAILPKMPAEVRDGLFVKTCLGSRTKLDQA